MGTTSHISFLVVWGVTLAIPENSSTTVMATQRQQNRYRLRQGSRNKHAKISIIQY